MPWTAVRPKGGPQPYIRLGCYCENRSGMYVWVEVYKTHDEMILALKRDHVGTGKIHPKTQAAVLSYRCYNYNLKTKKRKFEGEIGTVYFHKEGVTPANLAHEFAHVAIRWARMRRMNPMKVDHYDRRSSPEERVAHVVGNLVHQFYAKQHRRVYFIAGDKVRFKDLPEAK